MIRLEYRSTPTRKHEDQTASYHPCVVVHADWRHEVYVTRTVKQNDGASLF